jgi:osmotically-inducible protein OsmY
MTRHLWLSGIAATLMFSACATGVASGRPADSAPPPDRSEAPSTEFRDAYLKGRVVSELLLDPHVSVFDFNVKVENGVAYVSGTVDKDIERDIAVEVARGVDGIKEVQSSVQVKPGTRQERSERQRETLGQSLDDATVTASVKTKLLANPNTSGLRIHVNTNKGVVTLSGRVLSSAEKDLAGRIAQNTQGVARVQNQLVAGERNRQG